jgi:flagellar motility protein MotE (MotC chaperone)
MTENLHEELAKVRERLASLEASSEALAELVKDLRGKIGGLQAASWSAFLGLLGTIVSTLLTR